MKPYCKVPLPLERQIVRTADQVAALAFAVGMFLGSILTSGFWLWLTWRAAP